MQNPISTDRNRTSGNQNPSFIVDNRSHTPPNPADDHDQKLRHLLSVVQNFATSSDSSYGDNAVSIHPAASSTSTRQPMETDFFREVALFNAHFNSEPERSRWAQFLPEYLRPGNLENYLKKTDKPLLFGDKYWWISQESSGQDHNSRLVSVNQRKMPLVPDGQKNLQSLEFHSQKKGDQIRYSRDQLLRLREVKSISKVIMKIKQEIELDFLGVNQMLQHGATFADSNGTRRRRRGPSKARKKEEKKVTNVPMNAKQKLKTSENAKQEVTKVPVNAKQELKTLEKAKQEVTNVPVNANQKFKTRDKAKQEVTNVPVNAMQGLKTGEKAKQEVTNVHVNAMQKFMTGEKANQEVTNVHVNAMQEFMTGVIANQELTNVPVNAMQELKTRKQANQEVTNVHVNAMQEFMTMEKANQELTNVPVNAMQEFMTGEKANQEVTNVHVNAMQEFMTGEKANQEVTNVPVNAMQELKTREKANQEEISKKRKRGNSDERKARKKVKERKKRAEKNRKLGVTRLKIQPILKEKTISLCRHYMMGRCTEGEKCNFSHDGEPLTKSKACTHFARKSCMKGDDCPFDHDLSKYPCTNYESTGRCDRGNNCSFSHKIPPKQVSVSAVGTIKPVTKSIIQSPNSGNFPLGSSAQHNQPNISQKSPIVFAARAPTSGGTPKGTTTPMVKPSVQPHQFSTFKADQPVKAPKGLTFLNTGNSQRNDSATGMITNVSNPSKISEVSSPVTPNLTDNFMLGRSSNNQEKKESSFPTFMNNSLVATPGVTKDSGDTNQKHNVVPFKFPALTSSSNSLLTKIDNAQVKSASSSGQRSLLSNLPFAFKNDFGAMKNPFIRTPAIGTTEVSKSRGTDPNSVTQHTKSPFNAISSASATNVSADANKNGGSSSSTGTDHKKPSNPLDTFNMIFGGS